MKAYAKINLTLDITGKREDGYHLIDSVMQTVSLCDFVRVKRAKSIIIRDNSSIQMQDNLAFKAATAFFEYTKITGGADIYLKKAIPVLAGLGGGSSDAAAVIALLNKIYNTNLHKEQLEQIALKVGADVPFFITGHTARVTGIGENVAPVKPLKSFVVLVKEKQKDSTANSYAAFDKIGFKTPKTGTFCNAVKAKGESWQSLVGNDFLSVDDQPALINEIKTTNPLCVSLTGSGPTVYALYKSRRAAKKAKKSLAAKDRTVLVCKFV